MRKDRAERSGELVKRPRSIDTALAAFNAALPRQGRIGRQVKRAFIVSNGQSVSMRELRERWCYPRQPFKHWHAWSIIRALRKLGAQRIGHGIYATCTQHEK
jgi:hypothetical protein